MDDEDKNFLIKLFDTLKEDIKEIRKGIIAQYKKIIDRFIYAGYEPYPVDESKIEWQL